MLDNKPSDLKAEVNFLNNVLISTLEIGEINLARGSIEALHFSPERVMNSFVVRTKFFTSVITKRFLSPLGQPSNLVYALLTDQRLAVKQFWNSARPSNSIPSL